MAYIDPGSGSMMLQLIAGAVVGGLFVLKTSWGKLKYIFGKHTCKSPHITHHDGK